MPMIDKPKTEDIFEEKKVVRQEYTEKKVSRDVGIIERYPANFSNFEELDQKVEESYSKDSNGCYAINDSAVSEATCMLILSGFFGFAYFQKFRKDCSLNNRLKN